MLRLMIVLQIKGFMWRLSQISLHMQYEYTSVELSGFELLPNSSTCGTGVEGRKGGTVLAWKNSVRCRLLDISPNWIHMLVVDDAGNEFNLTSVYGPPHLLERPYFWQKLTSFSRDAHLPWILLGEFNQGNWFTWTNGRIGEGAVWERLDRALCNVAWLNVYPQTSVFCLPIYTSDYSPFVVLFHENVPHRPRPSRFEAMWLLDDSCKKVFSDAWNINELGSLAYLFVSKCRNVMITLKKWNREVFGHVQSKISALQQQIIALQQQVGEYVQDVTVSATEASLRNELEDLLDKEELLWAQKSHQMCLVQGDRNTKYFLTLVKKRRVNNRILRIKLDSGEWSQSYSEMESAVVDYFSNVFFRWIMIFLLWIYVNHLNISTFIN
ncbi:reverse transcriptase [Senna tora]|uniref:Reverse transcriptase n=1 Tax=Senna tora TaxID=362788 RepID=A0A834TKR2_9FABA|nr:reverse transcriptase [Senna tora]